MVHITFRGGRASLRRGLISGLCKGCKGHRTHRFENRGTNQLRKRGKREVVLCQPLPQTLYVPRLTKSVSRRIYEFALSEVSNSSRIHDLQMQQPQSITASTRRELRSPPHQIKTNRIKSLTRSNPTLTTPASWKGSPEVNSPTRQLFSSGERRYLRF